jgi:hypothetical protein
VRRFSLIAVAVIGIAAWSAPGTNAGPVATKSGAIINYVSTGKLPIGNTILIEVVCSVNCHVDSTTKVKGPGIKRSLAVSGDLAANATGGGPFVQPNRALLKAMKCEPGKFKLVSSITATDAATGASDALFHTFSLRRASPAQKRGCGGGGHHDGGGGGGGGTDCTPGYSPCIPPGSDVDCAGGSGDGPRYVQGPVTVTGSDPYGLDSDGNGVGCET